MLVTFFRTAILYLTVVIAMRIMGKRQIGQLQPSEFVVAIMLSELASIPMQNMTIPLIYGFIPIVSLLAIEILVSILVLKSRKARRLLEGKPSILIKHGILDIKELGRLRFNIDDIVEEIRGLGYPDIRDIEYGILETSGNLSIIPTSMSRPATPNDLSLKLPVETMPHVIISDGKMELENMKQVNMTPKDVLNLIKKNKIPNIEEIFYATIDENKDLYYQLKDDSKKGK